MLAGVKNCALSFTMKLQRFLISEGNKKKPVQIIIINNNEAKCFLTINFDIFQLSSLKYVGRRNSITHSYNYLMESRANLFYHVTDE